MKVDWDAFDGYTKEYLEEWECIDRPLYDLCKRYPDHSTPASVHAKLWLIGRTYQTGIERQIRSKGERQGESLSKLSKHMLSHSDALEDMFGGLTKIAEPLDSDKLKSILTLHGRFVTFLRPVLRPKTSPRAFAAKYMHFHSPAVPVYDSVANATLPRFVRWRKELELFPLPREADEWYGWFIFRFWSLYQEARAARRGVTVKLLDNFLMCEQEKK